VLEGQTSHPHCPPLEFLRYDSHVLSFQPSFLQTLSVNVALDNAHGHESRSTFYRSSPRLNSFHYQCSKSSTSDEIAAVFDRAIQRQNKSGTGHQQSFVFMDEAGLPEEGKESLKVLHYYLEGHMSTRSSVSFVAITNHVLDAAKSNRCVSLFRPEPGQDELSTITSAVLLNDQNGEWMANGSVCIDHRRISSQEFIDNICEAYSALITRKEFNWFPLFFGLRDFIFFLKAVNERSKISYLLFETSIQIMVQALQRNFNGCKTEHFMTLAEILLTRLLCSNMSWQQAVQRYSCRPYTAIIDALSSSESAISSRYKLILDESSDDAAIRLLPHGNDAVFKLSGMYEDSEIEKVTLISGVKFSALQGQKIVLSQTEELNESFYDLFNQNFRCFEKNGKTLYFANIAAGGISRPSQIHPEFCCVVHVPVSRLTTVPAPFLNRFEKFRLSVQDALEARCQSLPNLLQIVQTSIETADRLLKPCGMYGFVRGQTMESLVLNILSTSPSMEITGTDCQDHSLEQRLLSIYTSCFKNSLSLEDVKEIVVSAKDCLPGFNAGSSGGISFGEDALPELQEIPASMFCNLLQILLTRDICTQLLLLATPESVFANR
jgi:hypothetical protein